MSLVVKEMCIYTREDLHRLQHCMYLTFLKEPRLYYDEAATRCGASRNTISKYWRLGLEKEVFFPPQIRLNMYKNRKEYIYLIQSDSVDELFEYFQKQPSVIYEALTLGKFDLLVQTSKPLDVLPDRTLFWGSRGNYIYPVTPNYSFESALNRMEKLLKEEHSPSKSSVEYPREPPEKGSSHYGWMIFPYVKYNMRTGFTRIVKQLHIAFDSFFQGLEFLLNVSTVLLPYYPFGYAQYAKHFLVFWSDYEEFLCEFLGLLPSHTSIIKVNDALIAYVNILNDGQSNEHRFFSLCFKMRKLKLVNKFWAANPVFRYVPDVP